MLNRVLSRFYDRLLYPRVTASVANGNSGNAGLMGVEFNAWKH